MPAPKGNRNAVKGDGGEAATTQLQIRVTPTEKAAWVHAAQREPGRTLADYVRDAMRRQLAREARRAKRT